MHLFIQRLKVLAKDELTKVGTRLKQDIEKKKLGSETSSEAPSMDSGPHSKIDNMLKEKEYLMQRTDELQQ